MVIDEMIVKTEQLLSVLKQKEDGFYTWHMAVHDLMSELNSIYTRKV